MWLTPMAMWSILVCASQFRFNKGRESRVADTSAVTKLCKYNCNRHNCLFHCTWEEMDRTKLPILSLLFTAKCNTWVLPTVITNTTEQFLFIFFLFIDKYNKDNDQTQLLLINIRIIVEKKIMGVSFFYFPYYLCFLLLVSTLCSCSENFKLITHFSLTLLPGKSTALPYY